MCRSLTTIRSAEFWRPGILPNKCLAHIEIQLFRILNGKINRYREPGWDLPSWTNFDHLRILSVLLFFFRSVLIGNCQIPLCLDAGTSSSGYTPASRTASFRAACSNTTDCGEPQRKTHCNA